MTKSIIYIAGIFLACVIAAGIPTAAAAEQVKPVTSTVTPAVPVAAPVASPTQDTQIDNGPGMNQENGMHVNTTPVRNTDTRIQADTGTPRKINTTMVPQQMVPAPTQVNTTPQKNTMTPQPVTTPVPGETGKDTAQQDSVVMTPQTTTAPQQTVPAPIQANTTARKNTAIQKPVTTQPTGVNTLDVTVQGAAADDQTNPKGITEKTQGMKNP